MARRKKNEDGLVDITWVPAHGDIVHLDRPNFTYIDSIIGREGDSLWEIIDQHGEAFIIRWDNAKGTKVEWQRVYLSEN